MREQLANLKTRLSDLEGRPARFKAKGLESRIPSVLAEIERVRNQIAATEANIRWQDEIDAARAGRA